MGCKTVKVDHNGRHGVMPIFMCHHMRIVHFFKPSSSLFKKSDPYDFDKD